MSFVVIGGERYALPIGETLLGGSAEDALAAPELGAMDPAAVVEVMPDGTAVLRAIYGGHLLVDGRPMTGEVALSHGLRAEVGGVPLVFGEIAANGTTTQVRGVDDDLLSRLGPIARGDATADTGGRLRDDGGKVHEIPRRGITIGRDPSCDVVLADPEVSRRHATIAPSLQGYMLTDSSANGTHVNGVRVDGTVLLGMHDVVRLGDTELRFSADPANLEPHRSAEESRAPVAAAPAAARAHTAPRPGLLATLEVMSSGTLRGRRFRVERPVVHVGRGEHNDVRLDDSGVSSSHATITRRGTTWVVLDLGSTNGSYVDGERVTERALTGPAELRFGTMKLVFRPIGGGEKDASTRAIVGVRDEDI